MAIYNYFVIIIKKIIFATPLAYSPVLLGKLENTQEWLSNTRFIFAVTWSA